MKTSEPKLDSQALEREVSPGRRSYLPPRIVKKREVSRATLFTGSGPNGGGVIGGAD